MSPTYEDLRQAVEQGALRRAKDGYVIAVSRHLGGGRGRWVFDFRALLLQPHWLNRYAEIFWERYASLYPFQVCGMETAGIPLMAAIVMKSVERRTPVNGFYIRKSRKRSGLMQQVEGTVTDESVILVDDLVNTGRTLMHETLILRDAGKTVSNIFTLLRFRPEEAYASLTQSGTRLTALFTLDDFKLPLAEVDPFTPPNDPFEVVWRFTGPSPSFDLVVQKSAPVLESDQLFFGGDDGTFYALDAASGEVQWTFAIGKHPPSKGILSTPVVYKGVVNFGAYDGTVYALDVRSGNLHWKYEVADWVGSSPAIASDLGLLYIGLEYGLLRKRGGIVALNLATGKEVWQARHPAFTHGSPLYIKEEGLVVIGSNDQTAYAYDARTGTLSWRYRADGDIRVAPAYDPQRRLVLLASMDGRLYALDARTGTPSWARQTGASIYSIPLVDGDRLYVGSLDKTLYAIDLASGEDCWTLGTAGRIFGAPVKALGSLWIGSNDGRLYEVDPSTGTWLSYFQASERVISRVAVDETKGLIYLRTAANEIYCIKKKSG